MIAVSCGLLLNPFPILYSVIAVLYLGKSIHSSDAIFSFGNNMSMMTMLGDFNALKTFCVVNYNFAQCKPRYCSMYNTHVDAAR